MYRGVCTVNKNPDQNDGILQSISFKLLEPNICYMDSNYTTIRSCDAINNTTALVKLVT